MCSKTLQQTTHVLTTLQKESFEHIEHIVGNGEIAGKKHFLLSSFLYFFTQVSSFHSHLFCR